MKKAYLLLIPLLLALFACSGPEQHLKIAVTTDVHGMIFPVDLINRRPAAYSLAHLGSYLAEQRSASDTAMLLLDNGDFLQGQPTVYYYNTLRNDTLHISAEVMNYLGYEAASVGNHDIETGPAVYNRIREEFAFPWLAANAVSTQTGDPFFTPYTIIRKGDLKIAVLGMITPGIPNWLPKSLWPDLRFDDMVATAEKWIPIIQEKVHPDLIIGLFHSGTDPTYGGKTALDPLNENASLLVAQQVPGFDIIFAGHDHNLSMEWVANSAGDSVLVVDPGSHARYVGEVLVTKSDNRRMSLKGRLVSLENYPADSAFMDHFGHRLREVQCYLSDTVTTLTAEMKSSDGLFGPSSFITLIHKVQMEVSGAEISMTAPLAFNTTLEKGPVLISDMFRLYRFENMLYTMKLTGSEINGFLEHAAGEWFNTMQKQSDQMLLFDAQQPARLKNQYYNFSSAAGIDYSIDLTRPAGEKVTIHQKSDGTPWSPSDTLLVAVNSYRGNGGGGHLTTGSGIRKEELSARIVKSTEVDLRFYLMQYLAKSPQYTPGTLKNWKTVPEKWTEEAEQRDRSTLLK